MIIQIDPDYKKFPALKFVKGYDITLQQGNTVFMPSGYWHHIVYTTGGFSVSFRRLGTIDKLLKGGVNIAVYMPIDKLLTKILGNTWYNYKQKIAINRANQIVINMGEVT